MNVLYLLFLEKNKTPANIVNTFTEFVGNFTSRYEYDIWGTYIDWDSFVIAGGSIVLSLLVRQVTTTGSDVDLFFLKEDAALFERAVVR
jgi:hypothetical protein